MDTRKNEEPLDQIVLLDYPALAVQLRVTSSMERVHRAVSCQKEPWTVRWLETVVAPGDVLYDIGANVGTFSLIAALRQTRVIAFEPGAATYARLCENVVLNGCQSNVVPVPLALSDVTGLTGFKYKTMEPGQSRHSMETAWEAWSQARPGRYIQPICAMRLDEARDVFGLPAPHHLKIDVDGAEYRVLLGAEKTIRHSDVRSVLIEIAPDVWASVREFLTRADFALMEQHQRTTKSPVYGLFTRR